MKPGYYGCSFGFFLELYQNYVFWNYVVSNMSVRLLYVDTFLISAKCHTVCNLFDGAAKTAWLSGQCDAKNTQCRYLS